MLRGGGLVVPSGRESVAASCDHEDECGQQQCQSAPGQCIRAKTGEVESYRLPRGSLRYAQISTQGGQDPGGECFQHCGEESGGG